MPQIADSWVRRVVPKGFASGRLVITGLSPLLMNSPEADRESELFRAFTLLSQKKGKTLDDERRIREMEWEIRLYLDPEIGPYIPGRNIKKVLADAAGKFKKGETIKRSLITRQYRIPLIYDGPRDQQGLWDAGYRHTSMVQNAGFGSGRVVRCRPMFPQWALDVEIAFDPEEIDPDTLEAIVDRAQRYGLGDYRPSHSGGDFGQFAAILTDVDTKRAKRKGLAVKEPNGHDKDAHAVSLTRLTGVEA